MNMYVINRINKKGNKLIEYKEELMKDYSDIVRNSLIFALEQKLKEEVIDMDSFLLMKDNDFTIEQLKEYLLTQPDFSKTDDEIFKEFEDIREGFAKKLKPHSNCQTESVVETGSILVSKKFSIDGEFAMKYFGVDEKEIFKLMKRKGFIEKFAVLRLSIILEEIINKIKDKDSKFEIDKSLVYFDSVVGGYSIDLFFSIGVEHILDETLVDTIILDIKDKIEKAEAIYKEKL